MTTERHIRNVRETRERLGYLGKDLPDHACISWCGEPAYAFDMPYLDLDHAILDLVYNGGHAPCRKCLRRLQAIIGAELDGIVTGCDGYPNLKIPG